MEIPQAKKATTKEELDAIFKIRRRVFVEEQGVPAKLESADDEQAHHFIALLAEIPCGACRWRKTAEGYKLERFAVLPVYRNKGVGQALLKALLEDLPRDGRLIYLNAQEDAVGLYLRFGFTKEGEKFEEAGIGHYRMVRN